MEKKISDNSSSVGCGSTCDGPGNMLWNGEERRKPVKAAPVEVRQSVMKSLLES